MNSSFPNRWSFSYLKFTKYVTNIIAEPKYKYGQQEQITVTSKFEVNIFKVRFSNDFSLPLTSFEMITSSEVHMPSKQ